MTDPLTIVLTLKDRSAFTRRWMRYMNDIRCPHPILIADGGSDHDIEAHLRVPGNYPNLRYVYVRYGIDTNAHAYYLKLADIVDRVQTPYVLLADNDDFFLLDAIAPMLEFLAGHEDYVSCGGERVVLKLMSGDALSGADTGREYQANIDLRPKAIAEGDALDRLRYFLDNVRRLYLWSSWYAVHRTPALAGAVGVARTHRFADPVAHELHIHIALLLAGRVQQIDRPFFVNQAGTSQFTAALEAQGSIAERFASSGALADVVRSLEVFGDRLSRADRDHVRIALAAWLTSQAAPRPPAVATRPIRLPMLERYILNP